MSINTSRFSDLVDIPFLSDKKFVFIGCGSVGSNAARIVASMGVGELMLYDADIVLPENVHVSWLSSEYINFPKALALSRQCRSEYGTMARYEAEMYSGQEIGKCSSLILSTDSIASRKLAYDSIVGGKISPEYIVDIRVGGSLGSIYIVHTDNKEQMLKYEKTFEGEFADFACGAKAYPPLVSGWVGMEVGGFAMRMSRGLSHPYFRYADLMYNINRELLDCDEYDTVPEGMIL